MKRRSPLRYALVPPLDRANSGRLDSLDPATFVYKLSSKEVSAA